MNVSRTSLVVVIAWSFMISRPAPGDMVPTQATQAFLDVDPARRVRADGAGVTALYGTILASDNDPATDTDACVAAFLASNADALGVDGVVLEQTNKINIRNDKFTVYT